MQRPTLALLTGAFLGLLQPHHVTAQSITAITPGRPVSATTADFEDDPVGRGHLLV